MKIFCITGALSTPINDVARVMQQSGMQISNPLKRDESIDFHTWHRQVMNTTWEETIDRLPIEDPGRMWEQLAGELFLSNLKAKIWGWVDTYSAWLLDFWAAFDARIGFVLIACSPRRMIAAAIGSGQGVIETDQILADWQAWHNQMLRFHLRHPQRSILLDLDDVLAHPDDFIRRCNTQWKTDLHTKIDHAVSLPGEDVLLLHLAEHICRPRTEIVNLDNALTATIVPLSARSPAEPIALEILINEYRRLKDCSLVAVSIEKQQQQQIDTLTQAKGVLEKEILAISERLIQFDGLQAKLIATTEENKRLLMQLHQVEEELAHYFLLHQKSHQKLEEAQSRLQRMLQRYPDYLDCNCISAKKEEGGIRWRIDGFEAGGRAYSLIEFIIFIENGCVGYRFDRENHPLKRWPAAAINDIFLDIIPFGDERNKDRRLDVFFDLAICDLDLVSALGHLLLQTLSNPVRLEGAAEFRIDDIQQGILTFEKMISQFSTFLRYDTISLKREQVNPDYEHLWLRFGNLAFAGQRWPEFEFRFSCANVRSKHFGRYPKLEFPAETGQAPFEAWFEEAYDDFGAKYELRFALPNDIDIAGWQQISDRDREFILQLVSRLPYILYTLKSEGVQLKRDWQDWIGMALDVRHILTQYGK